MRGRSPSLQPGNPSNGNNNLAIDSRASSRASSPGRGRGTSISSNNRNRSWSHTSDQRDYILDLASGDDRSTAGGSRSRDASASGASPNGGGGAGSKGRQQKHPATFQCSLCPKRFTRAYNLRSHLRTHTDERPFVCTVCGKAFARQHDRKRHEGLHSGEKKFVCRGLLRSSTANGGSGSANGTNGGGGGGTGQPPAQWGCGRRFARADALGRHFRSEAGRVCIKPLLDEEAAERQRAYLAQQQPHAGDDFAQQFAQQQQHLAAPAYPQFGLMGAPPPPQDLLSAPGSGGTGALNFLPQALLEQYPALANIDWSALAAGGSGAGSGLEDDGVGGYGGRSSFDASSGGEFMDEVSEGEMDVGGGGGAGGGMNGWGGAVGGGGGGGRGAAVGVGDYLSDFEGR